MTPLPGPLGGTTVVGWRLDRTIHTSTWDSGIGAEQNGGRWNNKGTRVVYAAIDPATALVEVLVHKKRQDLDAVAHTLTSFEVNDPDTIYVVQPDDIPNPAWLQSTLPSAGQRQFAENLLRENPFVIIPSAVSRKSWNLLFMPEIAKGLYTLRTQERFALDTRLNPA